MRLNVNDFVEDFDYVTSIRTDEDGYDYYEDEKVIDYEDWYYPSSKKANHFNTRTNKNKKTGKRAKKSLNKEDWDDF